MTEQASWRAVAAATGRATGRGPRRVYGSPTGGRGCGSPSGSCGPARPWRRYACCREHRQRTARRCRRPGRASATPSATDRSPPNGPGCTPAWAPPVGATTGARRAPTSGRRPGRSSTASAPASSRPWPPPTARRRPASACSSWTPSSASTTRPGCPPSTRPPALDGLAEVARTAGWWWPYENVAVGCRRPGHHGVRSGPAAAARNVGRRHLPDLGLCTGARRYQVLLHPLLPGRGALTCKSFFCKMNLTFGGRTLAL